MNALTFVVGGVIITRKKKRSFVEMMVFVISLSRQSTEEYRRAGGGKLRGGQVVKIDNNNVLVDLDINIHAELELDYLILFSKDPTMLKRLQKLKNVKGKRKGMHTKVSVDYYWKKIVGWLLFPPQPELGER